MKKYSLLFIFAFIATTVFTQSVIVHHKKGKIAVPNTGIDSITISNDGESSFDTTILHAVQYDTTRIPVLLYDTVRVAVSINDTTHIQINDTTYNTFSVVDTLKYVFDPVNHTVNGHGYVDLGLPSGTLWAATHKESLYTYSSVGFPPYGVEDVYMATPIDGMYAFGETTPKMSFTVDNYCGKVEYENDKDENVVFNGYVLNLTQECDAVSVQWGMGWRMPTVKQLQELIDNCRIESYGSLEYSPRFYVLTSNVNGVKLAFTDSMYGIWTRSKSDAGSPFMYYQDRYSNLYPKPDDCTNGHYCVGVIIIER